MNTLADLLQERRDAIEAAVADARAELERIRKRESELLALVREAEAALGTSSIRTASVERRQPTLHEALIQILSERNGDWMTVHELAHEVTSRGLYTKRDGNAVEINQIHARTNNYRDLFEKDGPNVRLRKEPHMLSTLPDNVQLFRDDDKGFFDWLDENPNGFFINAARNPKPDYLVLHKSDCSHIDRNPSMNWTKEYIKLCASSRSDLEEWATSVVGGEVTLCRTCFG
jgi:hypothetical protein